MSDAESALQRTLGRLRRHPIVVIVLLIASVVAGLSSFTSATRNLLNLWPDDPPADVSGHWKALVTYDWGAQYAEVFDLRQSGDSVRGSVSLLERPRPIVEGLINGSVVTLTTRSQEMSGGGADVAPVVHRYRGEIESDTRIAFELLVGSVSTPHQTVFFKAHKAQD